MKYREEIDGLRAVAVLPVIFFHAGFSAFSGGYVGVDVFFVISGYLITTIILSEKEKGTFSLANFYERRARRIIPALFLVMLFSTVCSYLWLSPSHMKDFSESLAAVSLFSSNILFWKETGYWGVANELKPLLHTWSLAVEEQYYVLFPLFLMGMWRFRKRWILGSFFLIAVASLLHSQWASVHHPAANFFLLTTRAWELAIGAGIAFYFLYRKAAMRSLLSHPAIDELMSWLGLALIAWAVFVFDENTPFPGFYALIPTVGTALIIIFTTKETLAGRLLGSKIAVAVGLISYSAYLWHQPLFVFARHRSLHEPGPGLLLALAALSLILAYFSWKYVEAPFRRKGTFSRKQIFSFTAYGSLLFILIGAAGHFTEGFQHRLDKDILDRVNAAKVRSFSADLCRAEIPELMAGGEACVLVPGEGRYAMLFGDSHARTLASSAQKAFDGSGMGLLQASTTGCPPVKGLYRADDSNPAECVGHNERIYDYIEQNPEIEYVILVSRWTIGMEGSRFDNGEGGVEYGSRPHLDIVEGGEYLYHEDYGHRSEIALAWSKSIQSLLDAGKKVILIYPVPEAGWNVPDLISSRYFLAPDSVVDGMTASTDHKVFKSRNARTIEALDKAGSGDNLVRIFPEELFCDSYLEGRCITQKDGVIFYRDDNHLSDAGARLLLDKIMGGIGSGRQ